MPCNEADLSEPYRILDLNDISAFVFGFQAGCLPVADIAEPFGVCDLVDISTFVASFQAGCP